MKTLKILFLLVISINFSYAQLGELGFSLNEIKSRYSKEFKETKINDFHSGKAYSMFAICQGYKFCYFASYDSIVYESIAVPLNEEAINSIKDIVKKHYKKVSEFKYTHDGAIIEECYPDENDPLKNFPVYYKYYLPKERYKYY